MSSEGQVIPPGHHPPFAVVTPNDHRAWILVAAALGISFTFVTIATRILIRLFVNKGWGIDDTLCTAATILSWIQAGLVLSAAGDGLGRTVDLVFPRSLESVQRSYFASNIFYIISLDLSKLSVIFFLRRLVTRGTFLRKLTWALMIAIPVSMVGFVVATSLQCDLLAPWDIVGETCPSWFLRWQIHGIVEIGFEVLMCAVPILLVWGLQTSVENKTEVVLPFALRLLLIVLTSLRLGTFPSPAIFARDPIITTAPYICYTQAELTYSLIGATIPTARRLMLDFITYYNGGNFDTSGTRTGGASRVGASSGTEGIRMKSLKSARRKSDLGYGDDTVRQRSREGEGEGMVSDGDSQEMIIRKDVSIRIDSDMMRGRHEDLGRPGFM